MSGIISLCDLPLGLIHLPVPRTPPVSSTAESPSLYVKWSCEYCIRFLLFLPLFSLFFFEHMYYLCMMFLLPHKVNCSATALIWLPHVIVGMVVVGHTVEMAHIMDCPKERQHLKWDDPGSSLANHHLGFLFPLNTTLLHRLQMESSRKLWCTGDGGGSVPLNICLQTTTHSVWLTCISQLWLLNFYKFVFETVL